MSANKLTTDTIKKLIAGGIMAWRQNNQPTYDPKMNGGRGGYRAHNGMKGVPDIIAISKGQFIGLEVKYGKDKMSPDQILFKRLCERAGGQYHVITCIEDVDNFLLTI